MSHFAKNLQEASDEELMLWVNTLNPTYVTLASDELSRRETRFLREAMNEAAVQTTKLEESTTKFSKVLVALTLIQLLIAWSQLTLMATESDKWGPSLILIGTGVFAYIILEYFISKKAKNAKAT